MSFSIASCLTFLASLHQKAFAWFLSKLSPGVHKYLQPWKQQAFADLLQGTVKDVLEIGIGAGENMYIYAEHPDVHLKGLDPNEAFQDFCQQSAKKHGLLPGRFEWILGSAENLPLPDNSCDAVVATLVFCSVSDVNKCLREVKRVLRPGGKMLFLDHIGAKPGGTLRYTQELCNPAWKRAFGNCHLDRDTLITIRKSGFADVKAMEFGWSWTALKIQPLLLPIMAFARPLCVGVATV